MKNYKVITLDNLAKATAQQVFNHIVNHLIIQGVPSRNDLTCKNRLVTEDGTILKCAAGCLITSEQYEALESKEGRWSFMQEKNKGITSRNFGLISRLQVEHDRLRRIDEKFHAAMFNDIAEKYGLKPFPTQS